MGRTVLIVDDHASVREILASRLKAQGFDVCEAADGAEGVSKAAEVGPDIIVLDLSMPVMNGLEAARALKMSMPSVPLLLFTNTTGRFVEHEALAAGISSVFSKSHSCDLLVEDVKRRIANRG